MQPRKIAALTTAVLTGVGISLGGIGAGTAQASYGSCTPTATVSYSDGIAKASGSVDCSFIPDSPVGITVILYIDRANEGSSYRTCQADLLVITCRGTSVSKRAASNNVCARTLVSWKDPEGWHNRATQTGTGCAF